MYLPRVGPKQYLAVMRKGSEQQTHVSNRPKNERIAPASL